MRFHFDLRPLTLAALAAALAGCHPFYGRVQDVSHRVEAQYLGAPVARALGDLGLPSREWSIADLHSYTWETGKQGALGGNCTLRLVTDRSGTVVDFNLNGTPLGCNRLVPVSAEKPKPPPA